MYKIQNAPLALSPLEAGYDPKRIDKLNEHLLGLVSNKRIYCAGYAMSLNGGTFIEAAMGKQSYVEDDPRNAMPDSIFNIASITKVFTAIAIMQLVEDGKLTLAKRVCEYIPEFGQEPYHTINLFHLLTHTSGLLGDHGAFKHPYNFDYGKLVESGEMNWIEANLAATFKTVPPGSEWMYNSFGYMLLGEIITRVTGVFANDYIMENIVKPLGMNDTFFKLQREKADRVITKNEWQLRKVTGAKEGEFEDKSVWSTIPSTGGGLYSTLSDLQILGKMFLQNGRYDGVRILGRKSIEKMTRNHLSNVKDRSWGANTYRNYGLGVDLRDDIENSFSPNKYMHEGWGYNALMIDPDEQAVFALFTTFADEWVPEALYNTYAIMYSGIL